LIVKHIDGNIDDREEEKQRAQASGSHQEERRSKTYFLVELLNLLVLAAAKE